MKRALLIGLSLIVSACCWKDEVAYQQVTVVPVHESISCETGNSVDVTTTRIDHY